MKKHIKRIKKIQKSPKRIPALLFAVIFAGLGAYILTVTHAADPGTINLSPTQATLSTGSPVSITVKINSGSTLVTSFEAHIKYDTNMLQFVSADTSMSPFDTKLEAALNPDDNSILRITQGEINTPASGIQTVAVLTFQAKGAGSTSVTVNPTSHIWQNASVAQPDIFTSTGSTGTNLTLNDTTAPNAPGSLAASNTTVSGTTLNWTAPSDNVGVTGYKIYQDNTEIKTVTTNSYNVTSLTAGKTYAFKVLAFDQAGNNSPFSNIINVTTLSDTQAPSAPTNLTATPSVTSVALSWTASTDNVGVDHYDIYSGTNPVAVGHSTTNNFTVQGLQPGVAYSFKVQAVDKANNLSSTATVNSTTITDSVPPSAPGSLTISNQTNVSLTLNWTASTDNVALNRYDIYKDGAVIGSTTDTSFNITSASKQLTPSMSYTLKVVAVDTSNNSTSSANKSVTMGVKPGDINLSNTVDGDDYVIFAANFRKHGPTITRALGNLNYPTDDVIDSADFNILVSYWGK